MRGKTTKILFVFAGILTYGLVGEAIYNTCQIVPIDYGELSWQIFVILALTIIGHVLWMYIEMSGDLRG